MNLDQASALLHRLNQSLQEAGGQPVSPDWDDLPGSESEWMIQSNRNSILRILAGEVDPEAEHQAWYEERWDQGWRWGPERDNDRKLHPDMVPYAQLSPIAKAKDLIRVAFVTELVKLGLVIKE